MIEFIQANLASIVVVVIVIAGLMVLYKLGKKDTVKKIVLGLVVQAEKTLGSGTGELKYAMVIDAIYNKLPFILRFLFTKKEMDTFIEEAVSKMKDILSKGVTLTGYDDEKYISTLSDDTGQVNLTLSGVNIADNDTQWRKVGEKIVEVSKK